MNLDIQKYLTQGYDLLAEFVPKLVTAILIFIVAYIIAKVLGRAVAFLINKTSIGKNSPNIGASLSKAVFWVVMLIALPQILGTLGMESITAPLQDMAQEFLGFIPNVFGAGLIFFIGYIVATVARNAVESLCQAGQVDQWAAKAGLGEMTGENGISRILSILVFTLIIIPISISALDTLNITAISGPAKEMLNTLLNAIPNVFAACIVLGISFLIAGFASSTIAGLVSATGVDKTISKSAMGSYFSKDRKPSSVVGSITSIAIMVFGLIEAAKLLQFDIISDALQHILNLGGSILLGTIIIVFGVFAAGFISNIASAGAGKNSPMPGLIKTLVIILASAMGLKTMGVGDDIVTMGFTLTIGALALGSAIAIGFGAQETAKRLAAKWTKNL